MMGQLDKNHDDENQHRAGGGGVCNYGNQEGVYPREDKQETQPLSGTRNTSEWNLNKTIN